MTASRWIRWNPSTFIYEISIDFGANWNPLTLDGSIINHGGLDASKIISGVLAAARIPDITLPGAVLIYAGSSAPTGYLLCDGSAISRTTFSVLFGIIGTTYGAGNGTTTFNIPDTRGKFPLGKAASGTGSTLGSSGGSIDHTHSSAAHTHTYSDIVNHTHAVSITDPGHTHTLFADFSGGTGTGLYITTSGTGGGHASTESTSDSNNSLPIDKDTTGITAGSSNPSGGVSTGTTNSTTPGATGANNPPYLVFNFIIKT